MKIKNNITTLPNIWKYILLPIILLLLWLAVSFISDNKQSFLSLVFNQSRVDFVSVTDKKLLAGQKVIGKFTAQQNNLGIISVRFKTFKKINEDILVFRLKQANEKNWYYTAKYTVGQFQPDKLFTFGFPIITDAKNKQYIFEIESLKGKKNNSVAISYDEPVYVTQYKFTKEELLANKKMLFIFLFEKISTSFARLDFIILAFTYLVPLVIIYILFLHIPEKFFKRDLKIFYLFFIVNILNIFFVELQMLLILCILFGLWIIMIKLYKLHSSVSFTFFLLYLCIVPLLMLLGFEKIAEGFALWGYLFLLIGTVQALLEIKFLHGFTVSSKEFFGKIGMNIRNGFRS